jgi:hypothetical protein
MLITCSSIDSGLSLATRTPPLWMRGKKKKNGYTILNPVNGIFGLGHYPCLPTAQYYNINITNKNQVFFDEKISFYHFLS